MGIMMNMMVKTPLVLFTGLLLSGMVGGLAAAAEQNPPVVGKATVAAAPTAAPAPLSDMQILDLLRQDARIRAITLAVLESQGPLLTDADAPSVGPDNAKVAVVLFFDYQCVYCARQAPEMAALVRKHPEVRFIFKEWPIFGTRWEASREAARTGLEIMKQQGGLAYLNYHNALFATRHNEGALTFADIRTAARAVHFKVSQYAAPGVKAALARTDRLALSMGLRGTPVAIVMPSTGGSTDTTTVLPGLAGAGLLESALVRAGSHPHN